jgi:beta-glucosidase
MLLLPFHVASSPPPPPLYKVVGAPIPARVADLLLRMTLEEKLNQMALPFGAKYPQDYAQYNSTGLGATYPLAGGVDARNEWQRWQVEGSRLGIPTSFIGETLHSGASRGTVYPMPALQGCTWDAPLVQGVASAIALEASAQRVDRGFSPVLHFCTDPRFGRCEESFGEDPMLVAQLGAAAVTGLSGAGAAGAANTYLADPHRKIATEAKHYAAYGFGGRDGSMPAEISENTLYDVYLKPWYHYAQAGGRAIMAAHNEVGGMPCHGNAALIGALRGVFGFGDGLCASDAGDINSIQHFGVAPSAAHAAAIAVTAGMDQELQQHGAFTQLPAALNASLHGVNMSHVDRAAGNVLRQKFASGLFDGDPSLLYVNATAAAAVLDLPEHRALARRVAEEGAVLLRNRFVPAGAGAGAGAAALPLSQLAGATVAVIGPNADNEHSTQGGYTEGGAPVVTVLGGAIAAANASGNAFAVRYERGACLGATPGCDCPVLPDGPDGRQRPLCGIENASRIGAAAALAAEADVTVLVLGDSSTILATGGVHHETGSCGEHFDRDSLDPVGAQLPLLKAVLDAGKKVVVVLIHGRQVTFGAGYTDGRNAMFEAAGAVVAAWRPGEEAGHALWRILNGTVNPSGRSAHTWPRSVGQVHQYVPWFLPKATRPASSPYGDFALATPLVPFGFGLSYSNFTLSAVKLSAASVGAAASFNATLDVANAGPAGKCVVQVYFSQKTASRVRFQTMLLGFTKVAVGADATAKGVVVMLKAKDFEMWSARDNAYVVEKGEYEVKLGLHSADQRMVTTSITVV